MWPVVISYLLPCISAYAINHASLPTVDSAELDQCLLPEITLGDGARVKHDPYPHKPRITFNEDSSFKLTIFSDIHFGENPWDSWGPEQDTNTTALMRTLLNIEKPDYV